MKISEIFNLKKSQAELDFIDIDLDKDVPLFLDPQFLANRTDRWSLEATRTIRSFFQYLVTLFSNNKNEEAWKIFSYLSEPNETCLGLSRRKPKGRGVGPEDTKKIFKKILQSKAVKTGLVEDLEDLVIFVENFGKDKLSDMTTNIIRKHLINYTKTQCNLWNIFLQKNIPSRQYWSKELNQWDNNYTEMLVIEERKCLLVPKSVVSYNNEYTPQKFHTHFVLNFLQQEHLRLNTALVQREVKKDGSVKSFVTKKSIKETESPGTKADLNNIVDKHPELFHNFKKAKTIPGISLPNEAISDVNVSEVASYLRNKLADTPSGHAHAAEYHNLIIGVLEILFYPELSFPQKEKSIHQGRKRIDITFDNAAHEGLFAELGSHMSCQYIFVECKNYVGDPKNPELDQLSGRFSHNRGKVGLLVCRQIDEIEIFYKRCSDTFKDDRGLILPIVDSDLITALNKWENNIDFPLSELLRDRKRLIQLN